MVSAPDVPSEIINLVEQERTYWMDLKDVSAESFTLPIDRKVGEMLSLLYTKKEI
jgi:hypothetical protein